MSISKVERVHTYSPLRYPGGKTRLIGFFRKVIRANGLRDVTYVEPYAGGAGAALGLLISGQVERIVINDLDPAINAFWRAVVLDSCSFAKRVQSTPLTIGEWQRQKEIYKNPKEWSDLDLGFATFYLNRTNRSGVSNAGPIGGFDQSGNYKMDARFNREALLERVRIIGLYQSRIEIRSDDGVDIVNQYVREPNTLVYADPPYFVKGSSLYLNSFHEAQHQALANCLNNEANAKWVLTYDDVPQIAQLYSERRRMNFALNYSVHTAKRAQETMVFSDSLIAPASEDAWD
jgi:DNA adenine methylase